MDTELVNHLKNSATVLTPSRRLAARVRADVNAEYAKTQSVWASPLVYALDDWFHALWDQYEIAGEVSLQLLTQTQVL